MQCRRKIYRASSPECNGGSTAGPPQSGDIWTATYLLMGLRYDQLLVNQVLVLTANLSAPDCPGAMHVPKLRVKNVLQFPIVEDQRICGIGFKLTSRS